LEKEDLAGDIGQITGCLEWIKRCQDRVSSELGAIYDRIGELEQGAAKSEQVLIDLKEQHNLQRENVEREKDREISRANVKLTVVGIAVAIISTALSTIIVIVLEL